jgi:hypothetical protein
MGFAWQFASQAGLMTPTDRMVGRSFFCLMMTNEAPIKLIGRETELNFLRAHLRAGKNVAVIGPAGIGKTALVLQAMVAMPDALYCRDTATLKTACESLLATLGVSVTAPDNIQRKRAVLAALHGRRCCIVFDHIQRVPPKLFSLLENLHESYPMIVVSRSLAWNDIGHLKMILWDFDMLELGKLNEAAARRLVRAEGERLGLGVPDPRQFEHDLWRLSRGNPRGMIALCEQAKQGGYVFGRRFDVRLLDLDRRIKELNRS